MKNVRKIVSGVVIASMVMSLAACDTQTKKNKKSDVDTDVVIEAAEAYTDALKDMDTKKLKKLATEVDEDALDEILEKYDTNADLYDDILDTVEFEIDEDSAEIDDDEGSIKIEYTFNGTVLIEGGSSDEDDESTGKFTLKFDIDDEDAQVANADKVIDTFYNDIFDSLTISGSVETIPSETEVENEPLETEPSETEPVVTNPVVTEEKEVVLFSQISNYVRYKPDEDKMGYIIGTTYYNEYFGFSMDVGSSVTVLSRDEVAELNSGVENMECDFSAIFGDVNSVTGGVIVFITQLDDDKVIELCDTANGGTVQNINGIDFVVNEEGTMYFAVTENGMICMNFDAGDADKASWLSEVVSSIAPI